MTVINGIPENQNNGKTHKYSGIEWYSLKNRKGILCRNWATNGNLIVKTLIIKFYQLIFWHYAEGNVTFEYSKI